MYFHTQNIESNTNSVLNLEALNCNHSKHPCSEGVNDTLLRCGICSTLASVCRAPHWEHHDPANSKSPREHRCFPTLKSCSFHFALQSWYLFRPLGCLQSTLISPPQNSYGIGLHQLTINYE